MKQVNKTEVAKWIKQYTERVVKSYKDDLRLGGASSRVGRSITLGQLMSLDSLSHACDLPNIDVLAKLKEIEKEFEEGKLADKEL